MAWGAVAAGLGGALLGGILGGQKEEETSVKTLNVKGETRQETEARKLAEEQLKSLRDLITQQGPGAQDIQAGYQSQVDFANQLQQMAQRGLLPTEADTFYANRTAGQLLAPQQVQLQQSLEDERTRVARLAGQMGRVQGDPILQAKLAQARLQGEAQLGAQQQALATNIAMQLPGQRLGLMEQAAGIRSGLASQALQNRQTLLNLGTGIQSQLQNFRLGSAGSTVTTQSGGGLVGALTGAIGGAGAGLNLLTGFNKASNS